MGANVTMYVCEQFDVVETWLINYTVIVVIRNQIE